MSYAQTYISVIIYNEAVFMIEIYVIIVIKK